MGNPKECETEWVTWGDTGRRNMDKQSVVFDQNVRMGEYFWGGHNER